MALKPAALTGRKRKAPEENQGNSSAARKRQRTQAIRAIASQSTDAALSATGELNVASFIQAREYEIHALEKSMQTTRHELAKRAFQQVPRNMRRRTASHNVKKVPRRLRRRAEREMKDDNTPTVTPRRRTPSSKMRLRLETAKRIQAVNTKYKSAEARKKAAKSNASATDPGARILTTSTPRIKKNTLAEPPKASSKFKKRQIHKSWLPTHIWHAKRAHMTKPSEPLWRMAIPLSPTEKSYRPTHRASGGRGAIAWDMSYMATIGCEGVEPSLIAMLKAIGFGDGMKWGAKAKKWRKGTRSASGWTFERDNEKRVMGPITVIWNVASESIANKPASDLAVDRHATDNAEAALQNATGPARLRDQKPTKRKLFIRVHPSAFHQIWTELFKVAKMQRPQVLLEDLRFQIASIDMIGPGSTEALCAMLQPRATSNMPLSSSARTWTKLAGLSNPASLPLGAILAFNTCDPRLAHPRKSIAIKTDDASTDELTDLLVDWPPDNGPDEADMFSHKARLRASRCLASQKAIYRRKSETFPGEAPASKDTDPHIPVLLLASRSSASANNAQGAWTVLLPWKCLDTIWRCLMYYPLSSGGTPRFGGLNETRQIAFERDEPWFPGDFPGSEAGKAWERSESEKRYNVWKGKPPSRRVNYDSLKLKDGARGEHGKGWACDWDFLFDMNANKPDDTRKEEKPLSSDIPSTENAPGTDSDMEGGRPATKTDTEQPPPIATKCTFTHLPPQEALSLLNPLNPLSNPIPPATLPTHPLLATVRLTLLTRGTALPCARIYRLPPVSSLQQPPLPSHSTTTTNRTPKLKTNWRNDPTNPSTYPDEHADLESIKYRPPGMVPEALTELEKKQQQRRAKRESWRLGKATRMMTIVVDEKRSSGTSNSNNSGAATAGSAGATDLDISTLTATARERLIADLMRPSADAASGNGNGSGNTNGPATELELQCPPAADLIGFVTTGAYNLRRGRATAVGAVWVQRYLWLDEGGRGLDSRAGGERGGDRSGLCVVRNAGEVGGRLARWDVCV